MLSANQEEAGTVDLHGAEYWTSCLLESTEMELSVNSVRETSIRGPSPFTVSWAVGVTVLYTN